MSSHADPRCAACSRWALRPDCGIDDLPDGILEVKCGSTLVHLSELSEESRKLVRRMALGSVAVTNIGADFAPAAVLFRLGPVAVRSLVSRGSGREILIVESTGPGPPPLSVTVPAADTTLRWGDDVTERCPRRPGRSLRIQAGRGRLRVLVRDPVIGAVRMFRGGSSVREVAARSGVALDDVGAVAAHLVASDVLLNA